MEEGNSLTLPIILCLVALAHSNSAAKIQQIFGMCKFISLLQAKKIDLSIQNGLDCPCVGSLLTKKRAIQFVVRQSRLPAKAQSLHILIKMRLYFRGNAWRGYWAA